MSPAGDERERKRVGGESERAGNRQTERERERGGERERERGREREREMGKGTDFRRLKTGSNSRSIPIIYPPPCSEFSSFQDGMYATREADNYKLHDPSTPACLGSFSKAASRTRHGVTD